MPASRSNKRPADKPTLNEDTLKKMLAAFKAGETSEADVLDQLRTLPFEDLGFAKVDHHRDLRTGFPEVVFGEGKTDGQILELAKAIVARDNNFLVTRIRPETGKKLSAAYPEGTHHEDSRLFAIELHEKPKVGRVLVMTAGTSDIPVAEEAAVTASLFGCGVERIFDVGVAGVHRLLAHQPRLEEADVIIVAAGMEGALASVVASLSKAPVVGLPTSVGYGASFGGMAALMGMMNSCATGVSVVNIDNGYGAGCTAALICARARKLAGELKDE